MLEPAQPTVRLSHDPGVGFGGVIFECGFDSLTSADGPGINHPEGGIPEELQAYLARAHESQRIFDELARRK